jgi:predicted methyltransferase
MNFMKLAFSTGFRALLVAGFSLVCGYGQAAPTLTDVIQSAVADLARPQDDRDRDGARKPVESLQFSGVKPGDAVADFNAGGGYFTRLFADVVGGTGRVYALEPVEIQQYIGKKTAELQGYAADHRNITVSVKTALESLHFPRKLDLFWISQNYHDLHNKYFGPVDIPAFNKAVFDALKPGGSYVVLDHTAAPGSPAEVTNTLHRIDPATVRREVEAAGFVFDSESEVLANPADPRTIEVFDKSIQGHTDQFILKFRKPQSQTFAVHDGQGTVTVRKVWDGKAQPEEIEADGPKGHWEGLTLFLYNPSAHQWSQTFANSKVGTLSLSSTNVGEFKDGRIVLVGQDNSVSHKTILVRAVCSDLKPDSHQYEELYSNDGGSTWVRSFVANLTRLKQ